MDLINKFLPVFTQNILISGYNTYQYKIRQSGMYKYYKSYYQYSNSISLGEIEKEQMKRLNKFLRISVSKSEWYKMYRDFESLTDFPVLNKEDLISNLNVITTIKEKDAIASFTGGTTGASMKVLYTKENVQERHALLDHFRAQYGYSLGKKCAWFSGKNIVTANNIKKGICYRDDYINNIRFFSTFHITEKNFDVYWKALCKFKPEFIVGFPSSVYELCAMALANGLKLDNTVKVFFPTAETLLPHHREIISTVLGCKIANQYASSEGAPFILECEYGGLHIHPLTGVFEIVDDNMQPSREGEILVTSFTTEGTPLIRYRIGDRIKLASEDALCNCGSCFPLVERIEGRSTDYIISPTHGKVNLGNISNSTKNILGIVQFQVIQKDLKYVQVLVVANAEFSSIEQSKFLLALMERFGTQLEVDLQIVPQIPKEKSGKFRFVKNTMAV